MPKQYTVAHAAGIDICHIPALKDHLFTHWEEHDDMLMQLVFNQDCNWPYSDAACFQPGKDDNGLKTISQAFIEHIRDLDHFALGPNITAILL